MYLVDFIPFYDIILFNNFLRSAGAKTNFAV